MFPAPTGGSSDYIAFIAPVGSERTRSSWKEWGGSIAIGRGALVPAVRPADLTNGDSESVKRAGGTYSMGIAYLRDNDKTVTKAFYTTISVNAGSGSWTFATP